MRRYVSGLSVLATACALSACQLLDAPLPRDLMAKGSAMVRRIHDDGKTILAPRTMAFPLSDQDTPRRQMEVYTGTGDLIGPNGRPRALKPFGDDESYTVNLVNAPMAQAAKTVLGDILKLNYSVNPRVDGKITIQTSKPVSRAELVDLFQNALRASGAGIIRNGSVYQIEPADHTGKVAFELNVGAIDRPDDIGTSSQVVQLRYVAAAEMRRILEPMVPKGAILRSDDTRGTLTLLGTAADLAAMREAITVFDVDTMRGMSVALIPVSSNTPEAVVDEVRPIFNSDKEGPMSGMVRFIPNRRLKAVLVISPQQSYLARAATWIRRLDAKVEGEDKFAFTYIVRNRPAKELVEIVESAFSTSRRSGSQPGRSVAPRYQEASVQSASSGGGARGGLGAGSASAGGGGGAASAEQTTGSSGANTTQAALGPPGEEERIRVAVDAPNNALIIVASRQDYRRMLPIIQRLDIVPNQVMIEATIAEVSLNDDLKLGVRWYFQEKNKSYSLTDLPAAVFGSAYPGFSYALALANTKFTLNALNAVTNVNIISSPSLTVIDNRTAVLQIGDQVPIINQSAVSVLSPAAPIVNSVSYRDTGVILAITPRITEGGRVMLNIEQEVSNVATTTTSNIDSPTIKQRRIKTSVLVNNGEALALGGLIQDQLSDTRSQIPLLGDIPVVGRVFGQKHDGIGKTELLILITPYVMRNLNEAREITDEFRHQFDVYTPRTNIRRKKTPPETLKRALN